MKYSYKQQYYENWIKNRRRLKFNKAKIPDEKKFHPIVRKNTINNAVFHAWIVIDMHQGYSVHSRLSLIISFPYCFFLKLTLSWQVWLFLPNHHFIIVKWYDTCSSLLPYWSTSLPYLCSHFYFDIKFGNRLLIFKREEESLASSLLNIICHENW